MAKRFNKMTPKEKFVRLMIRGWKEKKKAYTSGVYKLTTEQGPKFCALGVVADELGLPLDDMTIVRRPVEERLGMSTYDLGGVTSVSDQAQSKTAAIKAVRKYLLGR